MDQAASLTELVRRMQHGDRQASNSVFVAAAQRLRSISQSLLSREPATGGFDASDLVQEVYGQKLAALDSRIKINDREHFFSLVANGMRQVLTDRARAKSAIKRQAPADLHRSTHQPPPSRPPLRPPNSRKTRSPSPPNRPPQKRLRLHLGRSPVRHRHPSQARPQRIQPRHPLAPRAIKITT